MFFGEEVSINNFKQRKTKRMSRVKKEKIRKVAKQKTAKVKDKGTQ